VEAICQGRQPAELSAETLLNRIEHLDHEIIAKAKQGGRLYALDCPRRRSIKTMNQPGTAGI
jgi:hypothetical protein